MFPQSWSHAVFLPYSVVDSIQQTFAPLEGRDLTQDDVTHVAQTVDFVQDRIEGWYEYALPCVQKWLNEGKPLTDERVLQCELPEWLEARR